jgi:hypothetical protein
MLKGNMIGNPLEITKQLILDLALGKLVRASLTE